MREGVDRTPAQLAAVIHARRDVDLGPVRNYLSAVTDPDRTPVHAEITAPSVEMADVRVTVSLGWQDPQFLGTFDRTAGTRMIQVAISARSTGGSTEEPDINSRAVDLPVREQIAWVRVVLGDLADYAYRILNDMAQLRVRPAFFVVFVDPPTPRLAPSDFKWLLVCGGRRAYPEKLVPENRELHTYLRRHGDMINADLVPHPQAPAPEVWAFEFVSQLAATFADRLGRMGAHRGFTFEEVSLHGRDRVVVRYTWHLVDGDKKIAFDIDLDGLRASRLREFDDPRARMAAYAVAYILFDQPQFPSATATLVDGVTWVRFGDSD
ncbi:hypothetical protein CBI38_29440 [Rhodococcus oxybenzonivorans]|uniref:Uncharacterized protein n=1 Tax=Rhodococcus oxybenzonivorans TaxID=1990687 RepID=A0A2S2C2I7_9NOCA|nr:hypothetical protein [Rhodococcus oxybenzonivorans]AWK75062.1 hypothetical protein CBI38_29440 [Rhodococcus oxybenzonivorans]